MFPNINPFIQCTIVTILLAIALLVGGVPSALNASDVQDDYIDDLYHCNKPDGHVGGYLIKIQCDYFEDLRNCQAATAVRFNNMWLCVHVVT